MLRISAVIVAVLALMGAPTIAAAQSQKAAGTTGCYNSATCEVECRRSAVGKDCAKVCQRAAATKPACK
jgi:hypothetical protein